MIDQASAEQLVNEWLAKQAPNGLQLAITHVEEHRWGWMFFYNTKKWLETRSFRDGLIGNSPVFVTRNGVFHEPVAGSGQPPKEHLRIFEALINNPLTCTVGGDKANVE